MIYAALLGTSFVTPSLLSGTAVLIALTGHGGNTRTERELSHESAARSTRSYSLLQVRWVT